MPRSAVEWVKLLEPLTPMTAADVILDAVANVRFAESQENLANALTAWAMCAKAEDE